MRFRLRRRFLLAALLVVVPLVLPRATGTASAQAPRQFVGPRAYYLALGDSLAYGFQPMGIKDQGYADDFYAHLQPKGTTHFVDMGCIAETVETFIHGRCPLHFLLRHYYFGPQLPAALRFIKHHRGQVSPVTLDIGANDFLAFFDPSTCAIVTPTGGLSAAIAAFDSNFAYVITSTQQALDGQGDLLTMNYYFPYQDQCFKMLGDGPQFQSLMALIEQLNANLASVAQQYGVPVVDVFTAFGGATTPNPNICTYTWMCSSVKGPTFEKVHPTTQGYAVIAQGFESLYGF